MTIPFTTFVLRFGELAVTQLWQVTLLAIVMGLIVRIGCRHRPHLAYLLWMIVVLKCLTPPVLSSPTSPFSWLDRFVHAEPVPTPAVATAPVTRPLPTFAAITADDSKRDSSPTERMPIVPPTSTINVFEPFVVAVAILWLSGIGVFTAATVIKLQKLRQMCRMAIELPTAFQDQVKRLRQSLGIRQNVRVAVVREQVRPAVFGFYRPTILLPATLIETASDETMEPILAHELIHVRRGDTLMATLQLVAQILWWFHPLVWWTNREVRRERERACDEEVVAALKCSPVSYARLLLNLLESLPAQPTKLSAASVTMLSFTARRLEHLVRGKARFHRCTPRSYWLIGIVALLVVLPGASIKWSQNTPLVAKADEAEVPPKTQASQPANSFSLARESPESTNANTEAHRLAVTEIKKLGGVVSIQRQPDGKPGLGVSVWAESDGDKILAKLNNLDRVDYVTIGDCRKVSIESFAKLKELPALRSLSLSRVGDGQLARLEGSSTVQHIDVISNGLSDAGLASIAAMPNLEEVIVGEMPRGEHQLTDAGIASFKKLKNLRQLAVISCLKVKGSGFKELNGLPNLQWIVLDSLDNEGLAAVAALPHVRTLVLTVDIPFASFAPLEKMISLEQLSLNSNKTPFDDSVTVHLAKLANLRDLSFSNAKFTDTGLAHLKGLTHLRSLIIAKGTFTDGGLGHLKNLTELQRLFLSGELDIGDEGLKNLAGMTYLTELRLPGKRITDEGLIVLSSMPDLQFLNLENSQIKGPGLQHLSSLTKLRRLELGGTLISDAELPRFEQFPALQELNLQSTSVSDAGVHSLGNLASLRELHLTSTKVTDAGLDDLAQLKKLRTLYLEGTAVTKEGKKRLEKLLPSLEINSNKWTLSVAGPPQENGSQSQDKPAVTGKAVTADETATLEITGEIIPDPRYVSVPEATDADTEAHRQAVMEIKKLGGFVSRSKQQSRGDTQIVSVALLGKPDDGKVLSELKHLTGPIWFSSNDCRQISPEAFATLKELPLLEGLQLDQVTDEQLATLQGSRSLARILLISDALTDAALATVATMPNLSEISIGPRNPSKGAERRITDTGIAALKTLTNLKGLWVGSCLGVNGSGLKELSGLPKLREVNLYGVSLDAEGLAAAANLPHLTAFRLSTTKLPAAAFAALEKMTSLERLSIYSDETPLDDSVTTHLAKLTKLRDLALLNTKLTDAGLVPLQGLTNLRGLHISKGTYTDTGLGSLKNLTALRRLFLAADLDVGDEGLKNLVGMTHLTQLDLPGKRISDAGLNTLAKLSNLRMLKLEKARIRGLELQQLRSLSKLRELDLGSTLVGDAELTQLAQLPALDDLDLHDTLVTDAGMKSLGKLTNLKALTLSGTKVTDAGLEELVGLKHLRTLQIDRTAITEEGRQRLRKILPSVSIDPNSWTSLELSEPID